jgi:hypothetical protein
MRRLLIPAAALAVAAVTLTGCGSGPDQSTPRGAVAAYYVALQSAKPASACAFKVDVHDCAENYFGLRPQDVTIKGLTIGRAQIHGGEASVPTSVSSWVMGDSGGGADTKDFVLVRKADGKWYLS